MTSNENKAVAEALNRVLADSYALYVKTQGYHWNVTGPSFPQLHSMFEEQYDELAEAVDDIAERIRAIDAVAPAGLDAYSALASISDGKAVKDTDMVADLLAGHETACATAKAALDAAEAVGDEVTVDMMIERMTIHDKTAWMLRSTLGK